MKTILFALSILCAGSAFAADGTATASDPPPGAITFRDLDTNRDGRLTFSEAFPNPRLSNAFNQIDQDADGFLTPREIADVLG